MPLNDPTEGCVPIACSLDSEAFHDRLDEWSDLLVHVARRTALANGVRLAFNDTVPHGDLIRLAHAEQSCCRFLAFAITIDSRGTALEVTAPPDASVIVHNLFGAAD